MPEVKWTEEQSQAINEKGSNILVAAAAGSGKTAVLVERIINKIINENIDIDKLLVVTFTNAAASEMRERILDAIYKKLEEYPENQNLQRQITLINKASICTIDSFCLEVVRNNFFELDNISPNFRIADTTEIELLKQEVIEDIFEEKYENQDENFSKLINTYTSYRDDTPLKELVLKIYSYIQSSPFPEEWLNEKIEMFNLKDKLNEDFSKTPWGNILLKEIEEEIIDDIKTLEDIKKELDLDSELESFSQVVRSDLDFLKILQENINNWDKLYEIYNKMSFVSWPRKKIESDLKEYAKNVRDDVKKKFSSKLSKILICNSEEANQDIFDMYEILLKLKNLILEFGKEFSKRKRLKNMVDFNDIEHLALDILIKKQEDKIEITDVAKRYQKKFIEIAIDEYQDSNLVQEYILTSISNNNNIFMVGDVKQSIYKFRQAMPELFISKYKTYKNKENKSENDNLKIQLFKNFRSRKNVLDFTNLIFENIMSGSLGDIEYNKEEYLNLGADYKEIEQNLKAEIDIINLKDQENEEENTSEILEEEENTERLENIQLEARFVASKIKELIENKFQVFDRKKNCFRDIKYKDIVVLLRSTKTSAPIFEEEIINLDMPVFSDSSQEYLDSIEIENIMSLLRIIDNPIQDIPLVTVLRSNIGKFTDDELVEIRLSDKYDNFYNAMQKAKINVGKNLQEKIEKFLTNLEKWRKEQEYLALDEFVWKLYSDTGYYNYVGLMPNGELRQANLKMLFERAKQFETASFKGLYNFINFIEKLKLSSGDLGSAKLIGENDDVIRIMSIHKSKGLEFPVVFLANTGKQFNLMDLNKNILLHQELGIGVKYINYDKQVQYDTLSKSAIKSKVFTETLSEEMRILYVALTRAKEKLYITGTMNDYEKEIEKMKIQVERYSKNGNKINQILIKKYKKYLDWINLVYLYEKGNTKDLIEYNVLEKEEIIKKCKRIEQEEIDVVKMLEEHKKDKEEIKKIEEILNFEYKHKLATTIPTMSSVTQIKQMQDNIKGSKVRKEDKEEAVQKPEKSNLLKKSKEVKERKEERMTTFDKPKFLKEDKEDKLTNAEKGTLVHLCMQHLNEKVEYNLEKIKELVEELERKEIITSKEKENINLYKILEFTKSNIWKEMKKAKKVYKERPFFINIPAKEIYKEEIEEKILIQGIIDLYYINENDEIILVDYKTDYVERGKEQELIEKYKKQLELYCKAIEEANKKQVSRIYIYSVYLGREIEYIK
ncbi:MAG: helicase-exonuclease AddAB subunit AddA [Clostridia bacterium]|nr:helicase-exonuclease AddAB subunit AddA [Clostridium sp.]